MFKSSCELRLGGRPFLGNIQTPGYFYNTIPSRIPKVYIFTHIIVNFDSFSILTLTILLTFSVTLLWIGCSYIATKVISPVVQQSR